MNGPWLELARALSVEQRGTVVLKEALPRGRAAFLLPSFGSMESPCHRGLNRGMLLLPETLSP